MPAAISSTPMPTTQRRSKPVNGSVLAALDFEAPTLVLGVVAVGSFVGSLAFSSVGVFSSLEGEVPLLGFGGVGVVFVVGACWRYTIVGSAATPRAGACVPR